MKRIILVLLILFFIPLPVFAESLTVTDTTKTETFNEQDYIPDLIKDKLDDSDIDLHDTQIAKTVIGFAINALKTSLESTVSGGRILIFALIVISIFYRVIDNPTTNVIIRYISSLVIIKEMFVTMKSLTQSVTECIEDISEILSAVLPSFSAILIMGGSSFTAITEAASLGAILTLLDVILDKLLMPIIIILMLLVTFERLSPMLGDINLIKSIRKNTITVITFVTMLMLTVISYQHIMSSGKDSVSTRTVKFAASNFIPIVGSAVGESLKTLGAGLRYLKTTVGGAVILSLLITLLPAIIKVFVVNIYFDFLSFTSGALGCKNEQGIFDSVVSVLEIISAIIICISVLSVLIVITFILSVFSITS